MTRTHYLIAATAGTVILVALFWRRDGVRSRGPATPAPGAQAPAEPQVLAVVGSREITDVDLARYQRVRELSVGLTGEAEALEALCDRTLLELAATDRGIDLAPAELQEAHLRRKLIIGALARRATTSAAPRPPAGLRPPMPGGPSGLPPSPMTRADEALAERGITADDFLAEVRAEALADKVKRTLVDDALEVAERDAAPLSRLLEGLRQRWLVVPRFPTAPSPRTSPPRRSPR